MHIAYCCPTWPPAGAANGIVSYVAAMREACMAQGHRVSIIAGGRLFGSDGRDHLLTDLAGSGDRWRWWRVAAERKLDRWRGHLPGVARLIAAELRAARRVAPIDIVEMEESFGWPLLVRKLACVPVVVRLHGPHFLKPVRPMTPAETRRDGHRLRAEGRAIRDACALTAPVRTVLDAVEDHYGSPARQGVVIPNPVRIAADARRWTLEGSNRDQLLFVGRFDYWKGADTLLRAFEQVLARRPTAQLVMAGPDLGIETGGGRVLGYQDWAAANLSPQARGRIRFLGLVSPNDLQTSRLESFACVIASRMENFPYSVFEAFAAGCPVISTDWHGARDLIDDDVTALVTPVGDSAAMADRILRLFDHPADAARIGDTALARCRERYSLEIVGSRMVDFYRKTLSSDAA